MLKFREYPIHSINRPHVPGGSTYMIEAYTTAPAGRSVLYLCEGYGGWFYITTADVRRYDPDLLHFWQHIPDITKKEDAIEFVKVLFRMGEV